MTDVTTGDRTIVAVLTPAGRGAVATIVVDGPRAVEAVAAHYRPHGGVPLAVLPVDRISVGRFGALSGEPGPGEEIVVCRRNERRVELHCHGGEFAAAMLVERLVEAGCEACDWKTWVAGSAANVIQSEVLTALAAASTTRTANVLLAQYQGALEQALGQLIAQLERDGSGADVAVHVDTLIARYRWGQHLTVPWRIVIAGRPNVGKSSLKNRIVGYERALVFDKPGTTRDVVWTSTAVDGWPVELADTAGLRSQAGEIESLGIERAQKQLASADLIVLVYDASEPNVEEDAALRREWPDALLVANKMDLVRGDSQLDGIATSALTGEGIDALLAEMARRLLPSPSEAAEAFFPKAVPFTTRQFECLQAAAESLWEQQRDKAVVHLERLIGANKIAKA